MNSAHAVARLRAQRLQRSAKPFLARGSNLLRCAQCRLPPSHCLCALRPGLDSRCGVCLLMGDIEPLKPTNTGWLIADLLPATFAFGWSRTAADPDLLALLTDARWQPYVVFPAEYASGQRVLTELPAPAADATAADALLPRPLFVLLDGTWQEARRMFRRSAWLQPHPVLSLQPRQASRYQLRRAQQPGHWCTAEVAAACLALAGEPLAAQTLDAYFEVFNAHYLAARRPQPVDWGDAAHQRLAALQEARQRAQSATVTTLLA